MTRIATGLVFLVLFTFVTPRPAAAFWSEVLSSHSSHSSGSDPHRDGDSSLNGAFMCTIGALVLGPADVGFGIYDGVIWKLGRKPPRSVAITQRFAASSQRMSSTTVWNSALS